MKPADELLFVRQKIKELKAREEELKNGFKAGDLDEAGDFAVVSIGNRATKRFDRKAAEEKHGDLSDFDVAGESTVINVEELENPDAA
ncbi:hypothetical protein PVV74_17235 [Roseovarius sp. SK2]|uniref:hypothetical protein n=1 Tax=Roseovarius TaxID=74030 RepID=UPI00237AA698|nr:hypothetical protein [Roseovarius sp. SK2]MDD9727207.1 hypothetical protein [Roseovarius sp. SK2]